MTEVSDIKAEIKNKFPLQKAPKENSVDIMEKLIFQKNLNFLRKEYNSKNQLINLLLENVFKTDITKVSSSENNNAITANKINGDYQFPKNPVETTVRKVLILITLTITNSMLFLSVRTIKMAMKIYMNQRYHQKTQYGSNSRNSQSKENVIKKNNKHGPDKKKAQEKTPGDHYFR